VKATARAIIEAPNVLRHVSSQPPITIRHVMSANAGVCALCVVGSAAGPLPGDELHLQVQVGDDASASLVAAGAMIAQGRDGPAARLSSNITVGERADLDADPGALIVCAGARVHVEVAISLATSATLRWRELIVLGRTEEAPGAATLSWSVRRGGRPLLRQQLDLSDPGLQRWPGLLDGQRVLLSELRVGPAVIAATHVHHHAPATPAGTGWVSAVTQLVAEHATLTTVLANDAATATRLADASRLVLLSA
jgi:urease accessory protein